MNWIESMYVISITLFREFMFSVVDSCQKIKGQQEKIIKTIDINQNLKGMKRTRLNTQKNITSDFTQSEKILDDWGNILDYGGKKLKTKYYQIYNRIHKVFRNDFKMASKETKKLVYQTQKYQRSYKNRWKKNIKVLFKKNGN